MKCGLLEPGLRTLGEEIKIEVWRLDKNTALLSCVEHCVPHLLASRWFSQQSAMILGCLSTLKYCTGTAFARTATGTVSHCSSPGVAPDGGYRHCFIHRRAARRLHSPEHHKVPSEGSDVLTASLLRLLRPTFSLPRIHSSDLPGKVSSPCNATVGAGAVGPALAVDDLIATIPPNVPNFVAFSSRDFVTTDPSASSFTMINHMRAHLSPEAGTSLLCHQLVIRTSRRSTNGGSSSESRLVRALLPDQRG